MIIPESLINKYKQKVRYSELTGPLRGLINRRDYKSDRTKGWRYAVSHARRASQKQEVADIIKEYESTESEFQIIFPYMDYLAKI